MVFRMLPTCAHKEGGAGASSHALISHGAASCHLHGCPASPSPSTTCPALHPLAHALDPDQLIRNMRPHTQPGSPLWAPACPAPLSPPPLRPSPLSPARAPLCPLSLHALRLRSVRPRHQSEAPQAIIKRKAYPRWHGPSAATSGLLSITCVKTKRMPAPLGKGMTPHLAAAPPLGSIHCT